MVGIHVLLSVICMHASAMHTPPSLHRVHWPTPVDSNLTPSHVQLLASPGTACSSDASRLSLYMRAVAATNPAAYGTKDHAQHLLVHAEKTPAATTPIVTCWRSKALAIMPPIAARWADMRCPGSNPAQARAIRVVLTTTECTTELRLLSHQALTEADFRNMVGCIISIHEALQARPEVLHRSIDIVVRFLACTHNLEFENFELLAITSLAIAYKYEQHSCPLLEMVTYGIDIVPSEICLFEARVLTVLEFRLAGSTIFDFIHVLAVVGGLRDQLAMDFAQYLIEIASGEVLMLIYPASFLAAAAISLALLVSGKEPWPEALALYTSLGETHIEVCVSALHGLHLCAFCEPQPTQRPYAFEKYEHRLSSVFGLAADLVRG